jgi:FAD/FMN-containing dehydrogenase
MALARTPAPTTGPTDFAAFAAGVRGTVIRPDDAAYEQAREVHNATIDRRPLAIVEASSAADVARTVVFARETGLELAVRGGAHSIAGHGTSEGGIVLDLGQMKGLHIDPVRRLAWAQAGLRAGEYTAAAAAHGLATPFGDTGSVGIGGLTLGGGIGWLVRKYGLAIDSLVSVEIVTADGRIVIASATENPDLFWAVRGGGGNFGVVTGSNSDSTRCRPCWAARSSSRRPAPRCVAWRRPRPPRPMR